MPGRRQSRIVRHEKVSSIRLQDRDLWLLESLAKMRFLTTSQAARLAFGGSRWAANKRLRKLLDAGLMRVWVLDLAEDNIYGLDRRGARLLEESDEEASRPTTPRGLDGNLVHLLAINDVRLILALELDRAGGGIAWWRSDWELRGRFRERVVPDALFAIRSEAGGVVFALEVDNKSRSWKGFLQKLLGYAALHARGGGLYGIVDFCTLVVCRNPRWLDRYRVTAAGSRLDNRLWFTTLDALRDQGLDAPIRAACDEEEYSLRMLVHLPYGKEAAGEKTSSSPLTYAADPASDTPS